MLKNFLLHRKGHACMIPGSKEFFIAAADHDEWGNAHTVFGMVWLLSINCMCLVMADIFGLTNALDCQLNLTD